MLTNSEPNDNADEYMCFCVFKNVGKQYEYFFLKLSTFFYHSTFFHHLYLYTGIITASCSCVWVICVQKSENNRYQI